MSELSTLSSCQCGSGPREEEGLGRGNMAPFVAASGLAWFPFVSLGAEHLTRQRKAPSGDSSLPFLFVLMRSLTLWWKNTEQSQQLGCSFCLSEVSVDASPVPAGGKAQHSVLLVGASGCPEVCMHRLQ